MEINFINSSDNDTGLCPSFKYTPFQQPNSCAFRGKQLKKKEALVQSCSFFLCFRYIALDWLLLSISNNFSKHTFPHRHILKPSCITLHDLHSSIFFSLYVAMQHTILLFLLRCLYKPHWFSGYSKEIKYIFLLWWCLWFCDSVPKASFEWVIIFYFSLEQIRECGL